MMLLILMALLLMLSTDDVANAVDPDFVVDSVNVANVAVDGDDVVVLGNNIVIDGAVDAVQAYDDIDAADNVVDVAADAVNDVGVDDAIGSEAVYIDGVVDVVNVVVANKNFPALAVNVFIAVGNDVVVTVAVGAPVVISDRAEDLCLAWLWTGFRFVETWLGPWLWTGTGPGLGLATGLMFGLGLGLRFDLV